MNKIEYFKGKDGKWYFHLIAKNGEIQCASEGYLNENNCINGIIDFKRNVNNAIIKTKEIENV